MSIQPPQLQRFRFASFELDCSTGELYKDGTRIKLQDQPGRLLILLVTRAGALVTREEIQEALWEDGQFVEFEHAINVAIKKIRDALGDDSEKPRFIETLPKKGYRFIADVEFTGEAIADRASETMPEPEPVDSGNSKEFVLPLSVTRTRWLFLLSQAPYIVSYLIVFYYWNALESAIDRTFLWIPLEWGAATVRFLSLIGLAVRIYLIGLIAWGHNDAGARFRKLFPFLIILDALWAMTPLLVEKSIGSVVSKAGLVLMIWLIFGQRTLMLRIDQGD